MAAFIWGKINPSYGMTYGKLERYDGQPLYSCDFCIPVYNEELEAATICGMIPEK